MAKDKKTQSKPAAPAEAAKPAETVKAASTSAKPAEVKPAAETKAPAVKKPAKPAAVKAEKPKAEKSAAKKSAEVKKDVFVIQGNDEHTSAEIVERCKAAYKDGSRKHVKSIDIYVKAESGELRAYYVVNGNAEGKYIVL